MNSTDILFVGGDVARLASVKIRCREIGERLGARCFFNAKNPDEIPAGFKAYLCVKPDFGPAGAERLAKRAPVIWDILDDQPPVANMTAYIASTRGTAALYRHLGRTVVLPHYHCNFENIPSSGDSRRVGYIGSLHWYPDLSQVSHEKYLVDRWERPAVAEAYRHIGLSLNLRNIAGDFERFVTSSRHVVPKPDLHIKINSGMKLINCLGFGLPSVSSAEPSYHEIAPECTVFTDLANYPRAVARLQEDESEYQNMRAMCLRAAREYGIDEIVLKYRSFFRTL